jgi:uncharacterized protein (DUF58 family)
MFCRRSRFPAAIHEPPRALLHEPSRLHHHVLTRAGWTVTALAALAIASGRLIGSVELYIVGTVAAMVVAAAAISVVTTRCQLVATRTIRPLQVHAGDVIVVELSVTNTGTRRSPAVVVIDSVGQRRQARIHVAPLRASRSISGRYQLATDWRGRLDLGPLRIQRGDPFGLTRVNAGGGDTDQLVVLPRVDHLPAPPTGTPDDPDTGAVRHRQWTGGDEFHTLRGYATGDDLRRVHWPTSARVDDLMVRQSEDRRRTRTTVVLDTREAVHTSDSFERSVSAAASILVAAHRRGDLVSLATTAVSPPPGGPDPTGSPPGHLLNLLEQLAMIEPDHAVDPADVGVGRRGTGVTIDTSGIVVVVTTTNGVADIKGLVTTGAVTRRTSGVLVVVPGPNPAAGLFATPGGTTAGPHWPVVTVDTDAGLVDAWTTWASRRHPYSDLRPPANLPHTADILQTAGTWNPVGRR